MAAALLAPDLDIRPTKYQHGSKIYTQIYQQTGGTTTTIPVAGTVDSIFEIPIKAFDLSQSFIKCTLTPTAGGALNINWFAGNTPPISRVELYTRAGQYLCQLTNAAEYDVVTSPFMNSMGDFINGDTNDQFNPVRALGDGAASPGRVNAPLPCVPPYTDMQYADVGTANTATPVLNYCIKLGRYKDTILALRKTLQFPDVLILKVSWGPLQNFAWISTSLVDPTAGAAAIAGVATLTNLALFLAVEQDLTVLHDLDLWIKGGFELPIPYVTSNVQSTAAGGQQSITVRVAPDAGFALKRLIFAPFLPLAARTALVHDNRNGAILTTFQTMLDSVTRQQYLLNCTTALGNDDWQLNRKACEGSIIQGRDMYQYNWFHIEDFSDLSVKTKKELIGDAPRDLVWAGIPIIGSNGATERMWTIAANFVNATRCFTFSVGYKNLQVGPGSIQVTNIVPASI